MRVRNAGCASYAECGHWPAYQGFFPPAARLSAHDQPAEEWWPWRGLQVHVDRYRSSGAVKMVLLHGGGGYGRLLSPLGVMCASEGLEVVAPDLPGYGLTGSTPQARTWAAWTELVADLVAHERACDDRPVVLLGASMGGVLALHAAAGSGAVAGVVATMLLDPTDRASRQALAPRWIPSSLVELATRLPPMRGVRAPIRLMGNMRAIANDPDLARLCGSDPHGGGSWVSVGFVQSFLRAQSPVPLAEFDTCPVLLAHPGRDRWTPVELSMPVFEQLRVSRELVLLEGCGHFPIEEPGVSQLAEAIRAFTARLQPSA